MGDTVTRYPLSWPIGWKRTPAHLRDRAKWGTVKQSTPATPGGHSWKQRNSLSVSQAIDRLALELNRLGAVDVIISTNLQTRIDGLPRSGQAEPQDPGAAVYFTLKKKDRCLACDRWNRVADNLAALAAHIGALRAIERWGVGSVDQAFAGYAALPPAAEDWPLVLGVSRSAGLEAIEAAYRVKARQLHPDVNGGDGGEMAKLNAARDAARKALGGH